MVAVVGFSLRGSLRHAMYPDDFRCIRIDGFNHAHDVVINRGDVRKRKKKPSKQFRKAFGHMRLPVRGRSPGNAVGS